MDHSFTCHPQTNHTCTRNRLPATIRSSLTLFRISRTNWKLTSSDGPFVFHFNSSRERAPFELDSVLRRHRNYNVLLLLLLLNALAFPSVGLHKNNSFGNETNCCVCSVHWNKQRFINAPRSRYEIKLSQCCCFFPINSDARCHLPQLDRSGAESHWGLFIDSQVVTGQRRRRSMVGIRTQRRRRTDRRSSTTDRALRGSDRASHASPPGDGRTAGPGRADGVVVVDAVVGSIRRTWQWQRRNCCFTEPPTSVVRSVTSVSTGASSRSRRVNCMPQSNLWQLWTSWERATSRCRNYEHYFCSNHDFAIFTTEPYLREGVYGLKTSSPR